MRHIIYALMLMLLFLSCTSKSKKEVSAIDGFKFKQNHFLIEEDNTNEYVSIFYNDSLMKNVNKSKYPFIYIIRIFTKEPQRVKFSLLEKAVPKLNRLEYNLVNELIDNETLFISRIGMLGLRVLVFHSKHSINPNLKTKEYFKYSDKFIDSLTYTSEVDSTWYNLKVWFNPGGEQ